MTKQKTVTLFGVGILGLLVVGFIFATTLQYMPIKASAQASNTNNSGGPAASPQNATSSGLLNTTGASNSSNAVKGPTTGCLTCK
ncbi:MAG: hypothetical protein ACJ706_09570 [Nitrososphaeraceae archaeon]